MYLRIWRCVVADVMYMLSGMLMMMAGALMIYKNKRKEVLGG